MSICTPSATSLLVFVDETGHEHFADVNHPVFGMGGCAVMADQYEQEIVIPWKAMKAEHFGGADIPLHACDLPRRLPQEQIDAMNGCFRRRFAKFAAVAKNVTSMPAGMEPYTLVALALMKRVADVARWQPMDRVVFIFESSQRLNSLADRHFPQMGLEEQRGDAVVAIPIELCRMDKTQTEPGLEVADFLVHTSGGLVRQRLAGKIVWGKDFIEVFQQTDPKLCSYIEIDAAKITSADGATPS
jgi:hypothetical protein